MLLQQGERPYMVYQDPSFVPDDHRLMLALHGRVVKHPTVYTLIDQETLVFGLGIPLHIVVESVCSPTIGTTKPAIYIGNSIESCLGSPVLLSLKPRQ